MATVGYGGGAPEGPSIPDMKGETEWRPVVLFLTTPFREGTVDHAKPFRASSGGTCMRVIPLIVLLSLALAGCVSFSSSNPPPPNRNTVVVPPNH
jgi:hypothetical protein